MKSVKLISFFLAMILIFGVFSVLPVIAEEESSVLISAYSNSRSLTVGESLCVKVDISGIDSTPGVNGYQFRLNYDKTKLRFDRVRFYNSTGNQCTSYEDEAGISVMWTSLTALSEDDSLVAVYFTAISAGTVTVTPVLGEEDCVYYVTESGTFADYAVSVNAYTTTILPDPATTLTLSASSAEGYDTVTADILLSNAVDIYGTQFELTYDATKLEFVSAAPNKEVLPYSFAVCNEPGKVKIAGATDLDAPINGEAVLATVSFKLIDDDAQVGEQYTLGFRFYVPTQPAYTWDEKNSCVNNITEILTSNGTVTVTEKPAVQYNPFDLNRSGAVDIGDVTALLNYLSGNTGSVHSEADPDLNNSGTVDIADVTSLLNYLSTMSAQPQ